MTSELPRCSDRSFARDEPIFGTASHVKRWLFLEQPGSWGFDALAESRLPHDVATELRRRARAAGVRVVLIRRGVRFSSARRVCYLARTDGRAPALFRLELDSVADVFDIDLSVLTGPEPVPGAEPAAGPLFLVCTHGRHDACCSVKGNQVSRLACGDPTADAWECSHIGGDRFAANLVCFPDGIYYGRVDVSSVSRLMRGYEEGRLVLDHYRGRCSQPFPVQAAEYFLRRELDLVGVDDVITESASRSPRGIVGRFSLQDGRAADVEVAIDSWPDRQVLTCKAQVSQPIPRYRLVSISGL